MNDSNKKNSREGNGNIIICGVPRGGTTSLFRYLADHPSIAISTKKEMNYFLGGECERDNYSRTNISFRAAYDQLFDLQSSHRWTLEASPVYMHPSAARIVTKRIHDLLPNSRLIILLRDPVYRLYSQFLVQVERNNLFNKDITFEEFVNMCRESEGEIVFKDASAGLTKLTLEGLLVGRYVDTIEMYLKYFSSRQIHLLFLDDLRSNPSEEMKRLMQFLSLDERFYDGYKYPVENKHISVKWKSIYRGLSSINKYFEPALNEFPAIRRLARELHNRINIRKEEKSDIALVMRKHLSIFANTTLKVTND